MPQFSQLLLSGDFAQGVTSYRDHYPGEEQAIADGWAGTGSTWPV
jgi:hypothetical protein